MKILSAVKAAESAITTGMIGALAAVVTMLCRLLSNVVDRSQEAPVDQQMVHRCLRGDDAAWEAIVRIYAGRIFRLCYRYTNRREESEDLTQEIFMRVYQNLHSFHSSTGSFQNWVLRLSRNLIIDRYRQSKRFQQQGGSQEIEEMHLEDRTRPSPERKVEQWEASQVVRRALRGLSPENKAAIILRDLHGLGYQEMASMLGIPEGTVKSRINRGRLALARQLSRQLARGAVGV